jgi:hypothetical protein
MFDSDEDGFRWAEAAPGPVLAVRLADTDPAALGDDDLVEVIAGWDRVASWAQAELPTVSWTPILRR